MKRGSRQNLVRVFTLLILGAWCTAAGQEQAQEKAADAIRAKDYETAIRLCLDGLRKNHADYQLNFHLSRAYAYSGRWDDALRILNDQALAHPENTDILLFRARVESWKKNYAAAEKGYAEVLRLSPDNSEALTGLAEVASWRGDHAGAIALYKRIRDESRDNPEAHFRLGRVYLWQGNYDKARESLLMALDIDPNNREYKRLLKTAAPRIRDQFEVRYEHQVEGFSDGRTRYLDRRLAFQLKLPHAGPLVFKAGTTRRFERDDQQLGIEFYPRLWPKAYAYLDLAYSPKAVFFPRGSFLLEIYQGIAAPWDFSLGYRRMEFSAEQVNLFLGSIGRYIGRYIAFFRWYYTPDSEGDAFSWTVNLRRYFTGSSYLYAGYGRGSKPFDIVSFEDYSVTRSWVFFAGFDLTFLNRIRIQMNYSHRDEGELVRNLFFLSTGYRW